MVAENDNLMPEEIASVLRVLAANPQALTRPIRIPATRPPSLRTVEQWLEAEKIPSYEGDEQLAVAYFRAGAEKPEYYTLARRVLVDLDKQRLRVWDEHWDMVEYPFAGTRIFQFFDRLRPGMAFEDFLPWNTERLLRDTVETG